MTAVGVHPLKLISLLLQYPDGALLAGRHELCDAAGELPPGPQGDAVRRFAAWCRPLPPDELQARYVETFDFSRQSSLYLTYHALGDRRQRGMALLDLKQRYVAAGLEVGESELPDYLPLVLEFAALTGEPGLEILQRHREAVELVRASLHAERSPWASLLDAVAAPLPGLTRAQLTRIRDLAREGPPEEEVGLEPFAPPEVMPPATATGRR
jgi:nitrate reductase molybdenum cofactor assembly chaperone NarJ/NarW